MPCRDEKNLFSQFALPDATQLNSTVELRCVGRYELTIRVDTLSGVSVSMSMSIKSYSVAKIAELLRSPQWRSRVTIQNQDMIVDRKTKCFRR